MFYVQLQRYKIDYGNSRIINWMTSEREKFHCRESASLGICIILSSMFQISSIQEQFMCVDCINIKYIAITPKSSQHNFYKLACGQHHPDNWKHSKYTIEKIK